MNENPLTAQDIEREFSDITEMVERKDINLSPEASGYLHENMKRILEKAGGVGGVDEKDFVFLKKVKVWMTMSEEWREQNPSIDDLQNFVDWSLDWNTLSNEANEAMKRGLEFVQWYDLLYIADVLGKNNDLEWIEEKFEFKDGKIICKGGLNLYNNSVIRAERLPKGLVIKGNLNMPQTKITELPEGIEIEGGLNAERSWLTSLPKKFKIGSDISLSGSRVAELPDNFEVNGLLSITKKFTELPKGLKVKGVLNLVSSNITEIPDDTEIGDDLFMRGEESMEVIGNNVKIGGDLEALSSGIEKIGENLSVEGSADFHHCKEITQFPESMKIKKKVNISGCINLIGLPANFSCTCLILSKGNLHEKVYEDAARLKKEGKIQKIKYSKYS